MPKDFYFIEPSAGTGAFVKALNKRGISVLAIDIDPKYEDTVKADFLLSSTDEYQQNSVCNGNPPFGRCSNLAIKFLNHAATFSQYIAFVLPRTFQKDSVKRKLDPSFHLIYEEILKKDSFIFEGRVYDVPCVYQIWERNSVNKRNISKPDIKCRYFYFIKDKTMADICVRRVGGKAGKAFYEILETSNSTNYYLKIEEPYLIKDVFELINNCDFTDVVNSTAGARSLSKAELVERVNKVIRN